MKLKIVELIKKLMTHERSARAIGSEAEAAAFNAQIVRLRERHSITEEIPLDDDPVFAEINEYDAEYVFRPDSMMFRRKRIFWEEMMFDAIARFCNCRPVIIPKTNLKVVAGLESDRKRVIKSYLHLYDEAGKLSAEYFAEADVAPADRRVAGDSFYYGFAYGVLGHLAEFNEVIREADDLKTRFPQMTGNTETTALIKSEKIIISAKKKTIDDQFAGAKPPPTPKIKKVDDDAYVAGVQAAYELEFSEELSAPFKTAADEIKDIHRRTRPRRSSGIFNESSFSVTVTYQPVQTRFIFDD